MAIAATTNWEFNTSSTANMVNGGGFNTANANFPTDGSWTSANTTTPILSSATYTFVSGDVGAWVYSSNTANPGFYKITAVNTGAATVNGTIGQGVVKNATTGFWGPSTVVGVDTSASVSSKTYGVDYSQQTTAVVNGITDFASVGSSTNLTSATAGFTAAMVGNIFHLTTTGTGAFGIVGWYEVVSYTNSTTVVLDRTSNTGTALVAGTGYIGGSLDLAGAIQSSFFQQLQGGNNIFIHSGSFTLGATTTFAAATNFTTTAPGMFFGYNSVRGDNPTGANRPTIAFGANAFSAGTCTFMFNIIFTAINASGLASGTNNYIYNCKFTNTNSTAARVGVTMSTDNFLVNCEAVCQNGTAVSMNTGGKVSGCYIHDSSIGIVVGARSTVVDNIVASCTTEALSASNFSSEIINNTLYGSEAQVGTAVLLSATSTNIANYLINNIIYGFTTGVAGTTTNFLTNFGTYNNYYNNGTDVSLFTKGPNDLALNPTFTSVGQLTGTTATSSGSVLTDSGASFTGNVTDNVDFLHVVSGTGATAGVYLITSHTNTTLTVNNAIGTSSGGNLVYNVPNKHNYQIGTNLKAQAFPGTFPGALTTGYLDTGAAQRQEPAAGTTGFFIQ